MRTKQNGTTNYTDDNLREVTKRLKWCNSIVPTKLNTIIYQYCAINRGVILKFQLRLVFGEQNKKV